MTQKNFQKFKALSLTFLGLVGLVVGFENVRRPERAPAGNLISAQENVPPDEEAAIQTIERLTLEAVRKSQNESSDKMAHRDAHHKAHGCVRAEFQVEAGLPDELMKGVFAEAKNYPAWVRFSNGSGNSQDDHVGDGRGMAIKVMNVPGEKILEDESRELTQDFLMINHPVFFVRNVADYIEFLQATANGNPLPFFIGINPPRFRFREFRVAQAITGKKVSDVLAERYWSEVPVSLGPQAMKFSAAPCAPVMTSGDNPPSPNFLRERLAENLSAQGACFDFSVQVQGDPRAMPIEDPTTEWQESQSPFVKVARVMIPAQKFDSPEQMNFCENLSYTPWHALPDHRPLGGINRARKGVYRAVSTYRHEADRAERKEPSP